MPAVSSRAVVPLKASLLALFACSVGIGILAQAAEGIVSRDPSYPETVEPICKHFYETFPHSKTVPLPRRAAVDLKETGQDLRKLYEELRSVSPRPSGFESQTAEWLHSVNRTASKFRGAAEAFRLGQEARARDLLSDLEFPPVVQRFEAAEGFHYCQLDPRKFIPPPIVLSAAGGGR